MDELIISGDITRPVCDSGLFYKTLLENSSEGIGLLDANANVKYCMSSIKRILGYEPADRIGNSFFNLIHPDDVNKCRKKFNQLVKAPGKSIHFNARFKHIDGSWKNLDIKAVNMLEDPVAQGIYIAYRDVTVSISMSRALQASEMLYKNITENTFDGITVVDFNGIVKFHSPALFRILGYKPEAGTGKSIYELMHPDSANLVKRSLRTMKMRKGEIFTGTVQFKHENQTWVSLEARAINLVDVPGIEGVLINYRDITAREKLESALRESEKRYKNLAAVPPVGIFTTDPESNCTFVNERWCEMSGLTFEASLGNGWSENIHPDDVKMVLSLSADAAANGLPSSKEFRLCRPDGRITWVFCQSVPETDESGKITGYIGSVTDITHRMDMQREMQQSEERYRNLVENAPEAIFLIDADTCKFVDFNDSTLNLFGCTRPELLGMNAIDACPPVQPDGRNSQESALEKIKEALKGGKPVYEWTYRNKKGELITCEERLVRFPPYDRKLIRGTVINIGEKKRMERALRESEERYRNMVENAHETIFVIDAENDKLVDFNENAVKLFGYDREKLLSMRVSDLLAAANQDGSVPLALSQAKTREALNKGKSSYQLTFRKAGGKTFPGEVHLSRFPPYNRKLLRGTVIDITEKNALEKKLRQQEIEYRHLASVSPVGIFRTDINGKTIYVNEKWCEITGIHPEEATRTGWAKAIHPEDRKWSLRDWKRSFKKKAISRAEYRFLAPDGKITWVLGEAVPDFDEDGKFTGYAGSITDITERVHAGQALAKSEQRTSVLLNAIPDLILRLSNSGTFLDYKASAVFKTVVPPEAFLGKKIKEVLPPAIADLCMKNINKAIKTGELQTYSYSLPDMEYPSRKNYFEARIIAYDNQEALALIRDITQQREAELQLKASEERWRSLVESAPQYIMTIDKNDRITFINYQRYTKPGQILGKSVFNILNVDDKKANELKKLLDKARRGIGESMEFSVINPKGDLMWFNVKAAPVKTGNHADELIVMALDITERKKAEQELLQSHEKLKELYQRLETIREEEKKKIAMEIHDELGQELTAIKLGMFWLQQYFNKKEGEQDIVEVRQKIKSLIELSAQTLGSARRLAHQLRPVVLDRMGLVPAIEWQVEKLNENSGIHCSFKTNLDEEQISKDFSVAIFRIVQESLTNMLRHSKASKAHVSLFKKGNQLILTIEDNGIGIEPADLSQPGKFGIFGMRERIHTWNGTLDVSGKRGKGTKLDIVFPMKSAAERKKTLSGSIKSQLKYYK